MTSKPLTIGLFGFGCVGQGLHAVVNETPGVKSAIKRICVKNPGKERSIAAENFTYDKNDLLQDPEIDTIVELIDNADEAFAIVKTALENGKAVVTANKKMVAEHYEELIALQREHKAPLLYEGSSCGSIPIIRNLEEYYDNDLLASIEGIANGTTNYVLSRMYAEGKSYDEVLAEAQRLGFAESDPTLDVDGWDAKYKLVIMTGHAFGVFLKPEQVLNVGVRNVSAEDLRFAKEKGYKIHLIASSVKNEKNELVSYVLPSFIGPEDPLFNVEKENNGVVVEAAFAEKQYFVGKGAGSYPTAAAVLSDVSALSYGYQYEYKKNKQDVKVVPAPDAELSVFLRYDPDSEALDRLAFTEVTSRFSQKGFNYLTGVVKLSNLLEHNEWLNKNNVFLALWPETETAGIRQKAAVPELAAV